MKKIFLKDIVKTLETMDWDILAEDLIKLEREYEDIKEHLHPDKLKGLEKLINLYESEKLNRVYNQSLQLFPKPSLGDNMEDVKTSWLDISEEELQELEEIIDSDLQSL